MNRREFLGFIPLTLGAIALGGCANEKEKKEELKQTSFTGVCYNEDVAIIVPEEKFYVYIEYDDYKRQVNSFEGNFAIFSDEEDMSSYDQARCFANAIVGENGHVFDYNEVMSLNYGTKSLYKK